MANNSGAYDPRQFLHYPEKDPFSDVAQRRLDELIKDFLNTGIAFVNGAGVRDINTKHLKGGSDSNRHYGVATRQEHEALGNAGVTITGEDDDEEFESQFSRVDKGKGRDEREGPGLKGLWNNTTQFSPGTSPTGTSVNDAASFLTDNGSLELEGSEMELEDQDGFFEETYENEENEQLTLEVDDKSENSSEIEFVPGHGHSPGSEQEIICIGDSDEEDELGDAISNFGSDEAFRNERERNHGGLQDGDHALGADRGSGSELEGEKEERQESENAWNYSVSRQDEDNNGQEPEWHQSQGKESDDDHEDFITRHGYLEDDRNDNDCCHRPEQPRRFFTSAPRSDPWDNSSTAVSKIGSPVLFPADWSVTSFQDSTEERQKDVFDGTEDVRTAPFESVREDLDPEITNDTEANEQGPPPELQYDDHIEGLSSFTRRQFDFARMVHLQPIPKLGLALPEHSIQSLEPSGLSSGASTMPISHAMDKSYVDLRHHSDLPAEPSVSHHLGGAGQASLSPPSAPGLTLDPEIHTPQSLDVVEVDSATRGGADLHVLERTSAVREFTPAGLKHVPKPADTLTVEEQAPEECLEHSLATAVPAESFLRGALPEEQRDSQEPVSPPDLVKKTHVLNTDPEERQNTSLPLPSDEFLPVELEHLQTPEPFTDILASQPLEPLTHSSPFAEEDSNEDMPKPVLLHPAVFDDQVPTHIEAQSQSLTPPDCDVEIYGTIEDMIGDEVVFARGVSEHQEDDAHDVKEVPLEPLEIEEVSEHHAGDVFSHYVVSEALSEGGAARTETASPPAVLEEEGTPRCGSEGAMPLVLAPAISVGSNTPPLSPAATVTNSSSAPDPSVATSDLSTVNQASVSVVTSTGSPPAIHVPRVPVTHANIRQPVLTYLEYASDEDHMGNGGSVLPDPRLPPEPTHLGIPMGVIGRSLRYDKEERAESMKVEPPRSESEGGSMLGEATNACEAEGTSPPTLRVAGEVREGLKKDAMQRENFERVVEDHGVSTSPVDQEANESVDVRIQSREEQDQKDGDGATDELVYPDSTFDRLGTENGEKSASQAFMADYTNSPVAERNSRSPSASPIASTSWVDISSSTPDVATASTPTIEVIPEPSTVDLTDRQINGHHTDLDEGGENLIHHKQNGTGTKRLSHSPPDEGLNVCDIADSRPAPLTPPRQDGVSPAKSQKSVRGKSKTVAADDRNVSYPPPPQSIIYTYAKRSPASRKRLRSSDPPLAPSKHPRLILSAAPKKPNGDATSTSGALDDKSEESSVISSSSAVSRLLVQRRTSSSPSISSRSSSMQSQPSPTAVDHVFMLRSPIRRYVPHSHNALSTSPVKPRRTSVERASTVHESSVSPSPTSPLGLSFPSSSTHQTRASCTDHKISIPGPDSLLYFLVPRCSLLDPEVVKDVNIVDCGVATKDEVDRAIGDLEALNLDSTTLGVIRQLAGIQLMREGQVGYLPQPGEHSRQRKHTSPEIHTMPPTHEVSRKLDPNAPSRAGSSQLASLGIESVPSPVSVTGSELSDITEAEIDSPSKLSTSEDEAVAEESFAPSLPSKSSPPKSVRSPRVTASRRRKLRPEDTAYKPGIEVAESSSGNESIGGKRRSRRASRRKTTEKFAPGDGNAGNVVTPPPKKKRKNVGPPANFHEYLDDSETPRKKARRKRADDHHAGDHVTTAV